MVHPLRAMTQPVHVAPSSSDPFDAGPFARLRAPLNVLHPGTSSVVRRAITAAAVAWVPLLVLAAAQGYALRADPHESLLLDFSAYARYLVALPLRFVGKLPL
jgi:hypothetical protein